MEDGGDAVHPLVGLDAHVVAKQDDEVLYSAQAAHSGAQVKGHTMSDEKPSFGRSSHAPPLNNMVCATSETSHLSRVCETRSRHVPSPSLS